MRTAAASAAGAAALDHADLMDGLRRDRRGADVVVDPVGGPSAEAALRALRSGGRCCLVGVASGETPRLLPVS